MEGHNHETDKDIDHEEGNNDEIDKVEKEDMRSVVLFGTIVRGVRVDGDVENPAR